MIKAIFWDRDGTLIELFHRHDKVVDFDKDGKPIEEPVYTSIFNLKELKFLPGATASVRRAKLLGFDNFIVSNQPWVGKGEISRETLSEINGYLKGCMPLTDIVYAFTPGNDDYKPNPGMLTRLQWERQIDMTKSWMIGDRWKDAVCAHLAKVRYIHVGNEDPIAPCTYKVSDLVSAVDLIEDYEKRYV